MLYVFSYTSPQIKKKSSEIATIIVSDLMHILDMEMKEVT